MADALLTPRLLGLGMLLLGCGQRYSVEFAGHAAEAGDPICLGGAAATVDGHYCGMLDARALAVLQPRCVVEDGQGGHQELSCRSGYAVTEGPTPPTVRIQARCQDDRVDALAPDRSFSRRRAVLPSMARSRAYLTSDPVVLLPNPQRPFDPVVGEPETVPVNTVVEILRPWPADDGTCSLSMVRIVDAGGRGTAGRWGYVRSSSLDSRPDSSAPNAREAVSQVAAEREAARAERLRDVTEAEVRRGQCDPRSERVLEQILHRTTSMFESMRSPSARHVGHEYVVATSSGATLSFAPALRGTYHLFAVGIGEVHMRGRDARGHQLTMRSEYTPIVPDGVHVDSIRILASAFDPNTLTVHGQGCVVVFGFDVLE